MDMVDVAIIDAGPFGLSAGAYLRRVRGLELRIFRTPPTPIECIIDYGK
jgi:thioredoxin reductase